MTTFQDYTSPYYIPRLHTHSKTTMIYVFECHWYGDPTKNGESTNSMHADGMIVITGDNCFEIDRPC